MFGPGTDTLLIFAFSDDRRLLRLRKKGDVLPLVD